MKKLFLLALISMLLLTSVFAGGGAQNRAGTSGAAPRVTYWMIMSATYAQVVQEYGQTEFAKEMARRTGIDIEWQSVTGQATNEAFNIMIASGNYPDIIEYTWRTFPGGPGAAIADNIILPLNDVFERYSPHVNEIFRDNLEVRRMVSTDDGTYYAYPFLRGFTNENNILLATQGWVIRRDWLERTGLSAPATPAEWYQVLSAFKRDGVEIPMSLGAGDLSHALAPGFDSHQEFYIDNNRVYFGPVQPERRNYLREIRRWYAEGLLDPDFFSIDSATLRTKVTNNMVGAAYGPGGSSIGQWIPAMRRNDPSISFVAVAPLTPVRGRNSMFSRMNNFYWDGNSAAISTGSRNVEAAARLLDFYYSPEGHMLVNFGIEGVTYNMVNGYPTYTEYVMNNRDGLSMTQIMSMYLRSHQHGPFVQDYRYLEQYYDLPELQQAMIEWRKSDMNRYMLPPLSPDAAEAAELARIMNNVNTYRAEQEARFIAGALDIEAEFDNYVAQIRRFGIDRAIEIYQNALARYFAKR